MLELVLVAAVSYPALWMEDSVSVTTPATSLEIAVRILLIMVASVSQHALSYTCRYCNHNLYPPAQNVVVGFVSSSYSVSESSGGVQLQVETQTPQVLVADYFITLSVTTGAATDNATGTHLLVVLCACI